MATKDIDKGNAIGVVLGDANLKLTENRAAEAAKLLRIGEVSHIAAIGTHREVDAMLNVFRRDCDIHLRDISYDGDSRDTVDNFYQTSKLIAMMGEEKSKLFLITSRFHIKRALYIFKKLGTYDIVAHPVHDTDAKVMYRHLLEVPLQLRSVINLRYEDAPDNNKRIHKLTERIKSKLYGGGKEE
ncbi:YdcF family protein [Candidatus Marsarchaeota archaeon]|jgi:uncharacterized SAM-binding protein YcdF (DUF218 family)|nr:YdcF family protein [Candidatus Marsarchaeota archaeon]